MNFAWTLKEVRGGHLAAAQMLKVWGVAAEQGKVNLVRYSLGRLHKQCSLLETGKHSSEVRAGWFSDSTWDWGSCPMVCLWAEPNGMISETWQRLQMCFTKRYALLPWSTHGLRSCCGGFTDKPCVMVTSFFCLRCCAAELPMWCVQLAEHNTHLLTVRARNWKWAYHPTELLAQDVTDDVRKPEMNPTLWSCLTGNVMPPLHPETSACSTCSSQQCWLPATRQERPRMWQFCFWNVLGMSSQEQPNGGNVAMQVKPEWSLGNINNNHVAR